MDRKVTQSAQGLDALVTKLGQNIRYILWQDVVNLVPQDRAIHPLSNLISKLIGQGFGLLLQEK
jgi:hypothetical protein